MAKRVSLRRVTAVATVLGILIPITLLIRTLLLGRLFGTTLELLLYPGSICLFNESRHSSLYGLMAFGLSLMATVAICIRIDDLVRYLRRHSGCMAFCAVTLNQLARR